MIYRLRDEDYLDLYGFVSPEETKEIFGERCYHPRSIRRVWTKYGRSRLRTRLDKSLESEEMPVALNLSFEEKRRLLKEGLASKKLDALNLVWSRVKEFESRWD
jgi:hypothetical protein